MGSPGVPREQGKRLFRQSTMNRFIWIIGISLFASPGWSGPAFERARAFQKAGAFSLAAEDYRAQLRKNDELGLAAASRLGLGQVLLAQGRASLAQKALQDYLERHPGGPDEPLATLSLARAAAANGQHQESLRAAQDFIAAFPGHALLGAAVLAQAEALYAMNRFQEADQVYQELGRDHPDVAPLAWTLYARAWCAFGLAQLPTRLDPTDSASNPGQGTARRENLKLAAKLFEETLRNTKDVAILVSARYQRAEALYLLADYAAAAEAYAEIEKKHPRHSLVAPARYSLAWCEFERQRWREASTAFHRFAALEDKHPLAPWAMYLAGVSLARAGDTDLAQSAYELTLSKYPGSPVEDRAHYGLAWLASARKDYVAAVEEYQAFLKAWPQSNLAPSALFLLADALYRQERYASAREQYLRLLREWPRHALAEEALYFAANASFAQGNYAQARDEFRQFLHARPGSVNVDEARLRLADGSYGLGELTLAQDQYKALTGSAVAVSEQAWWGLAWVANSQRQWAEAKKYFEACAARTGGLKAEALLRAGDAAYNLGQHDSALALYREAGRSALGRPLEADAHYQAAWACYRLRDFDQAYGEWGNALAGFKDPERRAEAMYWMAWALFRKEQYDQAAEAFAKVAEAYPLSRLVPDAWTHRGDALQNGGHCPEAIEQYKLVVAKYPEHPKIAAALHGLQLCYYSQGKEDEALQAAQTFLKAHKESSAAPDVQYRVAEHYLNRKDYAKAEKELDELKSAYPKSQIDLSATYWRGQARFKNLKFNEAIQDWKAVLARNPQGPLAPKASFKIGLAYYRLQEYAQAVGTFTQTLDAYGNTPDVAADAQFNLGMTFKRTGQDEEAIAAYQRVSQVWPTSPLAAMAHIRVGYIYEDRREFDKAIEAYRALAASDRGKLGAEAQFLIGDCYLSLKKSGEALLAYQQVVTAFPQESSWVVTALAKVGELYELAGKYDKALESYQRIVSMGGDPTWVASAKRRADLVRQRMGVKP